MADLVHHPDELSLRPLDNFLPDWLPPSSELPRNPEDAFTKGLALALGPTTGRSRDVPELDKPLEGPPVVESSEEEKEKDDDHVWELAAKAVSHKSTLFTWDTSSQVFRLPPLLSHHPELFYAALRKTVQTPTVTPFPPEYIASELRTLLTGYSGSLWIWNNIEEQFVPSPNAAGSIVVDGYSATASTSIFERFLTIGTLVRRLQAVPTQLMGASESWMHAFSHALTLVLSHIRSTLEVEPICPEKNLSSLHLEYETQEPMLVAVATLLRRDRSHYPPYRSLPSNMISALYKALDRAINTSAPHAVQCTLSFLLQLSTQPCIRAVEEALGLGRATFLPDMVDESSELASPNEDRAPMEVKVMEMILPSEVRQTLERGRKSLVLLKKACPAHILCGRTIEDIDDAEHLKWIWGDDEVQRVQAEAEQQADLLRDLMCRWKSGLPVDHKAHVPAPFPKSTAAPNEFDISLLLLPATQSTDDNAFNRFLGSHPPPLLPSSAPTLPLLLHHVFAKILARSKVISHALLDSLLSPASQQGGADLLAHLHILSSFHLLNFAPFTDLLTNALFVHPSPEIAHAPGTRSRVRARLGIAPLPHQVTGEEFAAVGLGVGLTQRGQWPPGGSDLNWILRRVVIDSLEVDKQGRLKTARVDKVWEQADSIVGFAIRDIEEGDDAWLDPLGKSPHKSGTGTKRATAVEALDFLDLQYKVPRSLAVVLSERAIQKYRQIFSFLLRVLRVDTVVRTMYDPAIHELLFPSSEANAHLLLRTRFLAQGFTSSLVNYLMDSALRSPWSAFYSQLTRVKETSRDPEVQDVFALAARHERVMNTLLEGCMLLPGQAQLAGEVRVCLGTILLLGQLVLDRRRGTLSEQEGGDQLRSLAHKLITTTQTLVQLLKEDQAGKELPRATIPTGNEGGAKLSDLLLRLCFYEPVKRNG
ncbi:hypothetical protein DACRYDRAFT_109805 [Dacryopinax primogenitus]|uniref:Spindle pole body component n=1 Tax=Dacryopinax primogenitus (strain DJM 731) TaxID=1858805 RepID=M5FVT2_DACPD|nr:uncharacterized protein DACRYDRAFT_109805 [Dacryopinax primogenitus]EJT99699.1 hypothetical protein DACRYDRAFT_109805 [Dacryopinax primogenitus]